MQDASTTKTSLCILHAQNEPGTLAKGQLWRTEKAHIRIMDLGKMLVHYKMLKDPRQMRGTQMSRIESMQVYLKTNRAKLVENNEEADIVRGA